MCETIHELSRSHASRAQFDIKIIGGVLTIIDTIFHQAIMVFKIDRQSFITEDTKKIFLVFLEKLYKMTL